MVQIRHPLLIPLLIAAVYAWAAGQAPKFAPDDPIQTMPPPLSIRMPARRDIDQSFDFMFESKRWKPRAPVPAGGVNTLGEVPDSEWFTNRHSLKRLSRDELQRGSGVDIRPVGPYMVNGSKSEGIMPGFEMIDANGVQYFVKGDTVNYPEMATAADVIGSKFLYALGYNTPRNEILDLNVSDLQASEKAKKVIKQMAHSPSGSIRVVASLAIDGQPIGPFKFYGTRTDDPNDITPHQDRRDLRGLYVFCAWINNTDAKAANTLDTVVEEKGSRFIRHHLIDFSSALGSDGDRPKDSRLGHEFMLSNPAQAMKRIFTLGTIPESWEQTRFPELRAVGNFESKSFEPDSWKPNYPNQAFLSRLPDDDFWGAKQVMAFTDDDIHAIVETARYGDPRVAEYVTNTLIERRDKIGRTFFAKVLPLDDFRVEMGELLFEDLGLKYGFHPLRTYDVQWSRFDNIVRTYDPIAGATSMHLPIEIAQGPTGSYWVAVIGLGGTPQKVSVYVRKEANAYRVVGLERTW